MNLNLNLSLNRYNSSSITARKTRFSLKRSWGQPLSSQAAILNFTIPPCWVLTYRKYHVVRFARLLTQCWPRANRCGIRFQQLVTASRRRKLGAF